MKKIDNYLESVYKNFNVNKEELSNLKAEMKSHILDEVNELQKAGYSEDESISMALDNFGSTDELVSDLSNIYTIEKYAPIKVLIVLVSSLIIWLPIFTLIYDRITFEARMIFPTLIPMYFIYEFILIRYYQKNHININMKYEIMKSLFIIISLILIADIIFPLNSYMTMEDIRLPRYAKFSMRIFNLYTLIRFIPTIILGYLASYIFEIKKTKNIIILISVLPIFHILTHFIISISGYAGGMRVILSGYIVMYAIGMLIGNRLYIVKH